MNILWTFCEHSVNILWTFCEHSVNILWTFCEPHKYRTRSSGARGLDEVGKVVGEVHRTQGSTWASPAGSARLAVDVEAVLWAHTNSEERASGRAENCSKLLLPELVAGLNYKLILLVTELEWDEAFHLSYLSPLSLEYFGMQSLGNTLEISMTAVILPPHSAGHATAPPWGLDGHCRRPNGAEEWANQRSSECDSTEMREELQR